MLYEFPPGISCWMISHPLGRIDLMVSRFAADDQMITQDIFLSEEELPANKHAYSIPESLKLILPSVKSNKSNAASKASIQHINGNSIPGKRCQNKFKLHKYSGAIGGEFGGSYRHHIFLRLAGVGSGADPPLPWIIPQSIYYPHFQQNIWSVRFMYYPYSKQYIDRKATI